jgi:hypothetical protein
MENIVNKKLYQKAVSEADAKYKRDGLYKSAYIQKRYKELGGLYRNPKPDAGTGITRWLKKEQWVQVLPYLNDNKVIQCGSTENKNIACRPLVRANSKTPITIGEAIQKHGITKIKELAMKKERNPNIRIDWVNAKLIPQKMP